ncbi:uncharacterized protein LOC127159424 [Labeo rohita]|uniref:uncharacterized protein LOC127159424 n=1 Tax=Labeo rohita TaxID=84645 RepID=UPI0021E3296B|nr:uncharacterized protein LOC127159424 [Labeo rohita]
MELFIFIVFQLLMEVQSYKLPRVKVSPDVIRESSAVKISCETPADVIVYQCHFYINREEKKMKTSESCELELTGAEVLRWAAVKSPGSLDINCYYTTNERGSIITSSDSDPATVTVLALVSTTTEQTITTIMKTTSTVMSTAKTTTYSKTVSTSTTTEQTTTTAMKTDAPNQGTGISCSASSKTYSLITSVPATSQPISGGLEHPESHQDSTADPTLHITSVNVIYQPSDVLMNKQQKQGNTEENENA